MALRLAAVCREVTSESLLQGQATIKQTQIHKREPSTLEDRRGSTEGLSQSWGRCRHYEVKANKGGPCLLSRGQPKVATCLLGASDLGMSPLDFTKLVLTM